MHIPLDYDYQDREFDPRIKIDWLLRKFIQNSQMYMDLGQNITIDEAMVFFRGRTSMKFYLPIKPSKWGLKLHCLVDSDTGYLYNTILDPGKENKNLILSDDNSFTESIIFRLLQGLENKGHPIFCDSWYSTIILAQKLVGKGFGLTSILRGNAKNIPSKFKKDKNSKEGIEYNVAISDNIISTNLKIRKPYSLFQILTRVQ